MNNIIKENLMAFSNFLTEKRFCVKLKEETSSCYLYVKISSTNETCAVIWYSDDFPQYYQIGFVDKKQDGKENIGGVYGIKIDMFSNEKALLGLVFAFAVLAEDLTTRIIHSEL